jgi:hypothetical protein
MGMEGGKIIRNIGGKSIKIAKHIKLEATKGNLTFSSPKRVNMIGKKGGVVFSNDYTPPLPLRVTKVTGPFNKDGQTVSVIKKGTSYKYKIEEFSRLPKEYELKGIRWATQFDDGEIKSVYPNLNGKKEVEFWVPEEFMSSKLRVYAYMNQPAKFASVEASLKEQEEVIIIIIMGTEQHSQTYGNK